MGSLMTALRVVSHLPCGITRC